MIDFTKKFVLEWSDRTLFTKSTMSLPIYHLPTSQTPKLNMSQDEKSVMHLKATSGAVSYFIDKFCFAIILSITLIKTI